MAAVRAWKDEAGQARLVGYVAPSCDTAAVQDWCRQRLLPSMIPSQVRAGCRGIEPVPQGSRNVVTRLHCSSRTRTREAPPALQLWPPAFWSACSLRGRPKQSLAPRLPCTADCGPGGAGPAAQRQDRFEGGCREKKGAICMHGGGRLGHVAPAWPGEGRALGALARRKTGQGLPSPLQLPLPPPPPPPSS